MLTIAYFAGGVRDITITHRSFASFGVFASWLESIEPGVPGVPLVEAPAQGASAAEIDAFKRALSPHKLAQAMFAPFVFMPHASKKREAASAMTALVLELDADFDYVHSRAIEAAARSLGWRGIVYSSFSHRSARPCLRYVLELRRPVSAVRDEQGRSDADHVRDAAIALLGGSERFDARESGLSYFTPSCPSWARDEALFDRLPGGPIDVDHLLRQPVEAAAHSARSSSAPARTRAPTSDDLAEFVRFTERRVARVAQAVRWLEVAQAVQAGAAIPGLHRDTALNAFYRSFASWFHDRHGAAPCPFAMAALCARTREATHGLSRPPTVETFDHWNAGHDQRQAEKLSLRASRAESIRAEMRVWLDGAEPAPAARSPEEARRRLGLT